MLEAVFAVPLSPDNLHTQEILAETMPYTVTKELGREISRVADLREKTLTPRKSLLSVIGVMLYRRKTPTVTQRLPEARLP